MTKPRPEWRQMISDGELMNTARAAAYCGVAQVTIRVWVSRGHLRPSNPGYPVPLYARQDLDHCDVARLAEKRKQHPRRAVLAGGMTGV